MAQQAENLFELARIRADNRDLLNAIVGTQGTALGRKNFDLAGNPTGDPCIIVYVPHKINRALLGANLAVPSNLATKDGQLEAPTDIVVTTQPLDPLPDPLLTAENLGLVRSLQWRDDSLDHIPSGAQVGFAEKQGNDVAGFLGTIGYVVRAKGGDGPSGFLTNQHVAVHPGHSIYIPDYSQPVIRVGVTRETMEFIADDEWFPGIDEHFAYVRTDAAFVEAAPGVAGFLRNEVPTLGEIGAEPLTIDLHSMDIIGKTVKKVGRTTGLQLGTVVAFGFGFDTEEELIDRRVGREPANFYTDLLVAPRAPSTVFSAPGDSGSAILMDTEDENDNRPVALLWGGWPGDIGRGRGLEDLTYGITLSRILDAMDLELVH